MSTTIQFATSQEHDPINLRLHIPYADEIELAAKERGIEPPLTVVEMAAVSGLARGVPADEESGTAFKAAVEECRWNTVMAFDRHANRSYLAATERDLVLSALVRSLSFLQTD